MTKEDIKTLTEIILDTQTQVADQINTFKAQMNARLDRFEARLERLEDDTRVGFDRVNTTLDGVATRLEDDYNERMALNGRSLDMRTGSSRRRQS